MGHTPDITVLPAELMFYASPPHECSYLEARQAVTLFADPRARMNNTIYGTLIDMGFRRSGPYVYRPRCPGCEACVPVRIPVQAFAPDRAQRRTWQGNADLSIKVLEQGFQEEHYSLYRRYIASRHSGGGMDVDDPGQYRQFLECNWAETRFVEFRLEGRLVMVAVTDYLPQGLSSVYTFFEPELRPRGLGTYGILWQVEEARRLGLPWVYLGYWIAESPKMAYKQRFKPLEAYRHGEWQRLPEDA
jgi:arginine-tRNA-protein transferase